ncbi:cation diffusion facilitator family transporter [Pectobacterium brasiliense]|uniref:Cation diffusion facilitator family transporter n=1 Tax=Pectobacterium parvum TaxID=2778550 RepID=A0ABW8G273_9GAMM|nr:MULTISPECIES: cation diffusion facilitator family transporter [Pectobacterium]APS30473.1 zinc transporter ZitB [Pectobacterium brasiliense]ARA76082.1 cation transporter [Pectobacterium brasiliense]KHS75998.1 zinc transporter ZitB [Pectobacterium brasiliense]KHS81996.1 zinc transporter ZitB [Pectobacterium brasiliense]KHT00416.1 zinc transporter ZitB [Pectobacterium brasiliense]
MSHSHSNEHHDHSHVPTVSSANERKVLLSFFFTFSFMIFEVIGGVMSGSLALIADAGHMLTDAAALALSYTAFRFGRRMADPKRTYGFLRIEVIAGFFNAIIMFFIVAWICYEALRRFQDPQEILAGPMLWVAIAGLIVNVLVFWILTRGDSEHVNIKGASLHVMGDLLGSVGAVLAAIIIHFTGWAPIDPILSVLVSLLVLRSAWRLLTKSLHILLEGTPEDVTPAAIDKFISDSVAGISSVSHIHVWVITSGRRAATLHIRPQQNASIPEVTQLVEDALKSRFNIEHVTVAVDWTDEVSSCSLSQIPASVSGHHEHHHHGQHQH